MARRIAFTLLAVIALAAAPMCAAQSSSEKEAAEPAKTFQTEEDETLYALGVALSQRLMGLDFSDEEVATIQSGLLDGLKGNEIRTDMSVMWGKIDPMVKARAARVTEQEKEAGQVFCDKAAAESGAQTTDSGAIYLELEPGDGESPSTTERVLLHYHGTLRDGTVFDSSVDRGEPVEFALNKVIPCFSEGVSRMKVGGKSRLTCPAETAYGDRGSPPKIRPGATIIFEVELLDILRDEAADNPS